MSTRPAPLFVIMFGPAGSGKSTNCAMYVKRYCNRRKITQLNMDDFVYASEGYQTDFKQLMEHERSDKNVLRNLFSKHKSVGFYMFVQAVKGVLEARKNVAVDTGARDVHWLSNFKDLIQQHGYSVHIVYPYVHSVKELVQRVHTRFTETGQVPVPEQFIMDALNLAPQNLKKLAIMYHEHLHRIAVIDVNQESNYNSSVLFQYNAKKKSCRFMSLEFNPCTLYIE